MSETIFYSWQSDLPNRTNRGLIERALEQAISAIGRDTTLDIEPRLDQDTAGVPGSPDIGATIFSKIDRAAVFVADVSLVTREKNLPSAPNPNVLIELGYALKALGSDRVILAFNTHYGKVEHLPFDLRIKRALTYSYGGQRPPKEPRGVLRRRLETALREIFGGADPSATEARRTAVTLQIRSFATELAELYEKAREVASKTVMERLDEKALKDWKYRVLKYLDANIVSDEATPFSDIATSEDGVTPLGHLRSSFENHLEFLENLAAEIAGSEAVPLRMKPEPSGNRLPRFGRFTYRSS